MLKISSGKWFPRVPEPFRGIQSNCCTNPDCTNFLKPPYIPGPEEKRPRQKDSYRLNSSQRGKILQCADCGTGLLIKSNQAIAEEIDRLNAALNMAGKTFCSNPKCQGSKRSFEDSPHLYRKNGFSRTGLQRLVCRVCGRSITVSDHRREAGRNWSHKDLGVFRALVNQVHVRAIARIEDMPIQAVYSAIDRIWR